VINTIVHALGNERFLFIKPMV